GGALLRGGDPVPQVICGGQARSAQRLRDTCGQQPSAAVGGEDRQERRHGGMLLDVAVRGAVGEAAESPSLGVWCAGGEAGAVDEEGVANRYMHAAVQGEDGQLGGDLVQVLTGGVTALGEQLRIVLRADQRGAVLRRPLGEPVAAGGDDLRDAAGVLEIHQGGEHAVLQDV